MQNYPQEKVEELKQFCEGLSSFTEAGVTYFLMEGTSLPAGCTPAKCDVAFCPIDRGDGYASRVFFPQQISSPFPKNWHVTNARLAERNWFAFSWKVNKPGLTLAQLVREHLSALVRAS